MGRGERGQTNTKRIVRRGSSKSRRTYYRKRALGVTSAHATRATRSSIKYRSSAPRRFRRSSFPYIRASKRRHSGKGDT